MFRSIGEERLPTPAGYPGMVWAYLPNPTLPHHHHVELEANLVLLGNALYLVGDQFVSLQRGYFPVRSSAQVCQALGGSRLTAPFWVACTVTGHHWPAQFTSR